jgi:hypothetical protein
MYYLWSKVFAFLFIITLFSAPLLAQNTNPGDQEDENCPQNIEVSPGASWRNITIGQSGLFDIEELFGIRFAYVVSLGSGQIYMNSLYVHLTDERAYREGLPTYTEVCVIEGKLATIRLVPDADSETPSALLYEWIQQYGKPDIVTWVSSGNDWCWRSIAWPDKGIILTVDAGSTINAPTLGLVSSVMFAPFLVSDDPLSLWPYSALATEPPTSNNEGCPAKTNPFDFEAMLKLKSSE